MTVTSPAKGEKIRAQWGADVAAAVNSLQPAEPARGLAREGAAGRGSEPLPANPRERRGLRHPFEVFGETGDDGPALLIHIPAGSVWYGDESLSPDGVTLEDATARLYSFDFETSIGATPKTVWLVICTDDSDNADARFALDPSGQTGETVRAVLPIAVVSIDTVGEDDESKTVGCVRAQHAHSPFVVTAAADQPGPSGALPQAFDLEPGANGNLNCVRCICDAGSCADVAVNPSYPALYLHVVRSTSTSATYAVTVDQSDHSGGAAGIFWSKGDEMQWTLYTFEGGSVSADHRPRSLGLHLVPENTDITPSIGDTDRMVTAFRYDVGTHCLQVKVRKLDFATYPGTNKRGLRSISRESGWTTVTGGECSPHTDEHPAQGSV